MGQITGVTRGGTEWVPAFIVDLNQKNCIGCGRCFKACPRDVFDLVEREDLDLDDDDDDDYDDDGFSDDTSLVVRPVQGFVRKNACLMKLRTFPHKHQY